MKQTRNERSKSFLLGRVWWIFTVTFITVIRQVSCDIWRPGSNRYGHGNQAAMENSQLYQLEKERSLA
jgi:hypothetical protein